MITSTVLSSNKYRGERKRKNPGLKILNNRKILVPFSVADIFHLLTMMYYFGIVKLPAKRDYWNQQQYMT
eukprot:10536534-Ditylum_brightwellii.AAC.1